MFFAPRKNGAFTYFHNINVVFCTQNVPKSLQKLFKTNIFTQTPKIRIYDRFIENQTLAPCFLLPTVLVEFKLLEMD
jgi:hypothetical protein